MTPLTLDQLQLAPRIDQYPPRRFVIYGKSGYGKSTFSSTFPGPKLVQSWDADDKATPYWKKVVQAGGQVYPPLTEDPIEFPVGEAKAKLVVPVRYGLNKKGKVVVQVESYTDPDPEHPTAFLAWKARMVDFRHEAPLWSALITDSTTQMAICARNVHQYITQAGVKDPRLWFGGSTDDMERAWTQRFPAFRCNVVLNMHIKRLVTMPGAPSNKEDIDGVMTHMLAAPGRLAMADGVPSQYGECYRIYLSKDVDPETGERIRLLQTRAGSQYHASTQIDAPNHCVPDYQAIWSNYALG